MRRGRGRDGFASNEKERGDIVGRTHAGVLPRLPFFFQREGPLRIRSIFGGCDGSMDDGHPRGMYSTCPRRRV